MKKPAAKRARKSVRKAAKTAALTAAPAMVPQAHGGALLSGGKPGNAGGNGRPSNELRDQLRGALSTRVPIIEAIADGEPVQTLEVPLLAVLPHAKCPKCGEGLKAADGLEAADLLLIQIKGRVSASPNDRLKALEMAARYGLGAKELVITGEKARAFFDCVHTAIVELASSEIAEKVQQRAIALMDGSAR